jgi:acyl transferase domain-containing protein
VAQRPIAVIGIGARFPQSDGLDAFWRNLVSARDCVCEIPAERWDAGPFVGGGPGEPGRLYAPRAGMDADADCYDADFFQLDPGETARMDPQQGLALELAWHACEDAGMSPATLAGRNVGVYVGVSTRDFDRRMANRWPHIDARTSTGASGAIVANRISYVFGLTGPSLAIDGACASSLASVHQACRALDDDECELALAGGVQLILSPANIIAFSQHGLLARDGRCKPFSAQADGYVCGEGGGFLLLKPLEHAERDGDLIRAVLVGSAINHNGRSNGLSAPYRAAQQQAMRTALSRAGVAPASIGYVEAHSPGTLIGDLIEIQAIRDVYGAQRDDAEPCFVGSVKSNIGHLEAAAGIAALVKTALMVEHGTLVPSLHCETPNAPLKLAQGPVRLSDRVRPWSDAAGPRRAGVSAFSFGGGNAHVIVEQPPLSRAAPDTDAAGPWVIAVSAATDVAFARVAAAYAQQILALRDAGASSASLRDFCAATLASRQPLARRRAFVVRDWDDALAALAVAHPVEAAGAAICRLALDDAADETANASWPALDIGLDDATTRALLRPVALLARLGATAVQIDGEAPALAVATAHASGLGLRVTRHDASRARGPALVLCAPGAPAEFAWRADAPARAEGARLAALLYERGLPLAWPAYAALAGAARTRLPRYPFDRSRHHVVHDDIDPDRPQAETVAFPSLRVLP